MHNYESREIEETISTIKRFLPLDVHVEGKKQSRHITVLRLPWAGL